MTRSLALVVVAALVALVTASLDADGATVPGSTFAISGRRLVAPGLAREAWDASLPGNLTWCNVRFVLDGDTLDVRDCADAGRVRLILVDAPEAGVCFAAQATAALRQLLPVGSPVGLQRDVSNVDQYGRYLRYAWTSDGLVNELLARQGFVRLAIFPPDTVYLDRIKAAESEARAAELGLWAGCVPSPPVLPPGGVCDPSYPTVCIPPPPPDLDCRDVPYRRFAVLPPDPHRFDGDRDGVGCE